MTVLASDDDGDSFNRSLLIWPKTSMYSSMQLLPSGEVILLFERDGGNTSVVRFNVSALKPIKSDDSSFHPHFRDFVGVNDFGGSTRTLDLLGVTMARPTGADWGPGARPFAWGGVQPRRGQWKWAASDAAVAEARAFNRTVLPILGYTAQWASATSDPYSPAANGSDWAAYCYAVAQRYCSPGGGGAVTHIQIWNEPAFLPDKPPVGYFSGTMEQWVDKIHLPAAALVRAAGCKVVFGGWPSCPGCGLDLLRQTLAQKNMFRTVDVIDVHYRDV
jgi:hypothetical protein